jgi:putative glutamine transport system permease protein
LPRQKTPGARGWRNEKAAAGQRCGNGFCGLHGDGGMNAQVFFDIFTPPRIRHVLAGLRMTILISLATVFLSVLLGSVLAICRSYSRRIAGRAASVYIEIFRSTPLLLWILFCIFMLPFGNIALRGGLGLTLYTGSVIAEIVRGGLNAIDRGQYDAARSQGFNFVQCLRYIVLPQCFMHIVPSLMSQIITTIKDTSFLAQFAIAEFFFNSKQLLGIISRDTVLTSAHIFVLYGFIALVYFTVNFVFSCLVRALAKPEQALFRRRKSANPP